MKCRVLIVLVAIVLGWFRGADVGRAQAPDEQDAVLINGNVLWVAFYLRMNNSSNREFRGGLHFIDLRFELITQTLFPVQRWMNGSGHLLDAPSFFGSC